MTNPPSSEVSIRSDAYYRASPDGKMIAMTGPDADNKVTLAEYSKVRLYSTETGKLIKTLENGVVNEMLWSPDSNSLIVSSAKLTATEKEEFKKYRLKADKLIEEFDADGDETLDKSEAERMRESRRWKKLFDESRFWKTVAWSSFSGKDEDGFLTKEQIAKALWKGNGGSNFYALETRIINIESGDEILLEANDGDTTEEEGRLCFEKDQSTTRFVNPVLLGRQIVLPLFDASTFRNGYRAVPGNVRDLVDDPASRERYKNRQRTNEAVVLEDKLGFFDLKTGKLNKLVELNCEFGGRQFSVTEQMISFFTLARHSRSDRTVGTSIVLDRLKGNRAFAPSMDSSISAAPIEKLKELARRNPSSSSPFTSGAPYLSPTHPFIGFSSKGKIEIWKLDSKNSTFNLVKTVGVSESSKYGVRNLSWNPSEPSVSWIDDGVAHLYRVDKDQMESFDAVPFPSAISATSDGWLVVGRSRMVLLDRDFKIRKSYLPTERFANLETPGKFDQCVAANGKTFNSKSDANMRMVQMRENRIETVAVEDFEQQMK